MSRSAAVLLVGFALDLIIGDPHAIPHPVALIGRLISLLEKAVRRCFPGTPLWQRVGGGLLWAAVVAASAAVPALLLWALYALNPWLGFGMESVMCCQILATKSLRDESGKVYTALAAGDVEGARYWVSRIVGRDTERLDAEGIARAAVETVAENTSDGVVAPMLYLALGGPVLGFAYKAVNTMDSMLGYIDPPYTDIGFVSAKADDVCNLLPARLSALLMLAAGGLLGMDVRAGWRIFRRDRYNHASPNSAQTESVCAGLLGLRLAGDAWYCGHLHCKPYIGDDTRRTEPEDIRRAGRLLYVTAFLALAMCTGLKMMLL